MAKLHIYVFLCVKIIFVFNLIHLRKAHSQVRHGDIKGDLICTAVRAYLQY